MKAVLQFPPETKVEFKSHDSSIQQRTAIDEQRKEKSSHTSTSSNARNGNKEQDNTPLTSEKK